MFKKIVCLFVIIGVFLNFVIPVDAATGYEGYAVYRDGVFYGFDWHTGLMDKPSTSYSLPVIHHSGTGYVKWDSWSNFVNGKSFKGVYKPNRGVTSSQRDLVKAMGRNLRTQNISYSMGHQVDFDSSRVDKWIYPEHVLYMRCDGVVEYSYEYHGIRIYGDDDWWDVSWGSAEAWVNHAGTYITPKRQAMYYMTLVTSTPPTGTYK